MSSDDQTGRDGRGSGTIKETAPATGKSALVLDVPNWDGANARSYLRLGAVPNGSVEPGGALTDLVLPSGPTVTGTADASLLLTKLAGTKLVVQTEGGSKSCTLPASIVSVAALTSALTTSLTNVTVQTATDGTGALVLSSSGSDGGSFITVSGAAADLLGLTGTASGSDVFLDDGRDRGTPYAADAKGDPSSLPQTGADADVAPTAGTPDVRTPANRRAESSKLLTKGGWRDHSDGNRISTTQGDKVEIIRGNYKLLVLGRQDDPDMAAGWEGSGGLIVDGDAAPGSISEIKWVKDYDGTWHVTEETEKGSQKTVYHGDVEEIFYGNNITSTIGSEPTPAATLDLLAGNDPASKKLNPTITEQTWAARITSTTGSEAHPVPFVTEQTWADHISDTKGSMAQWVKDINEEVYVHDLTSLTHAGGINERTVAGGIAETTICTEKQEFFMGAHTSIDISAAAELFVGAKAEIFVGAMAEVHIGGKRSVNICPIAGEYFAEIWVPTRSIVTPEDVKLSLNNLINNFETKTTAVIATHLSAATTISSLKVSLGVP